MSRRRVIVQSARIVVGACAVALSAYVDVPVPGSPVPQSLQTLLVLLVGAVLGARDGGLAIGTYLIAGGLGVPVFADGASGWPHLVGPTAGYLAGFLIAAVGTGWIVGRRPGLSFWSLLGAMAAAHGVILGLGWLRLAADLGAGPAWDAGVTPFLVGGLAKSIVAAVVVRVIPRAPAHPPTVRQR